MNYIKRFNEGVSEEGKKGRDDIFYHNINVDRDERIVEFCKDHNLRDYVINADGSITIPSEYIQSYREDREKSKKFVSKINFNTFPRKKD